MKYSGNGLIESWSKNYGVGKILSKTNLPEVATRQRCGRACPKQIMGLKLAGKGADYLPIK